MVRQDELGGGENNPTMEFEAQKTTPQIIPDTPKYTHPVITRTAEELNTEIAKLQGQLDELTTTKPTADEIEVTLNDENATEMALDNEFLKLKNQLIQMKYEINEQMTKKSFFNRFQNKENKEKKVAKKIIEKFKIKELIRKLSSTISNILSENKIGRDINKEFSIDENGDVFVTITTRGIASTIFKYKDIPKDKTYSESLIKAYMKLINICRLISERFTTEDINLEHLKEQIDKFINQMDKYESGDFSKVE